jgi:hypothetical protein
VEDQGGRRWEELREDEVIVFKGVIVPIFIIKGELRAFLIPCDGIVFVDLRESEDVSFDLR